LAKTKLARKQEKFVAKYMACLDATKSAIYAGYSKKSAMSQGCQLLKNPKVAAEIAKRSAPISKALGITAEMVMAEIGKLAFFDARKLFNDDQSLKMMSELDDNTAACIAGLEITELFEGQDVKDGTQKKTVYGIQKKAKVTDKLAALKIYAQHLGQLVDKVEHSGKLTLEQLVCGEVAGD